MKGQWHGGKGSTQRPTNHNKFSAGYDLAFGKDEKVKLSGSETMKPINYDEASPAKRKAIREQYVEEQNGKCMWCHERFEDKPPEAIRAAKIDWGLFPPFFLKHPIHLQHDHDTGMTEGAVHALCNAYMWQFEGR